MPNPTIASLRGLSIDNRFSTKTHVGRGGFGHVYSGIDRTNGNAKVAIKVVNCPSYKKATEKEVKGEIACLKDLMNVPGVTGYIADGRWNVGYLNLRFIAMELGSSSIEDLKSQIPFTAKSVVSVGIQMLDALDAIHSKGWIHRDIKCANIVLFPQQQHAKLCDFGLSGQILKKGRRVVPNPLPPRFYNIAYVSPNINMQLMTSEVDDGWMLTYSLLQMTGFAGFKNFHDQARIQYKLDLGQNPRAIINPDSYFLRRFIEEINGQQAHQALQIGILKNVLKNSIRASRNNLKLTIKVSKTGQILLK